MTKYLVSIIMIFFVTNSYSTQNTNTNKEILNQKTFCSLKNNKCQEKEHMNKNQLQFELNTNYRDNGNEEYDNSTHDSFHESIYIPSKDKEQISNIIDLSQEANSPRFASIENVEQSLQLYTSNEYSEHDSEKQFSFKNANILPSNNDDLLANTNIKECLDMNCILLEEKPKKPMDKFLDKLNKHLGNTSKLLHELNNTLLLHKLNNSSGNNDDSGQYSKLLYESSNSVETTAKLLKEFKEYLIEEKYFLDSLDDSEYYT